MPLVESMFSMKFSPSKERQVDDFPARPSPPTTILMWLQGALAVISWDIFEEKSASDAAFGGVAVVGIAETEEEEEFGLISAKSLTISLWPFSVAHCKAVLLPTLASRFAFFFNKYSAVESCPS